MTPEQIRELVQNTVRETVRTERERTAQILRESVAYKPFGGRYAPGDELDWNTTVAYLADALNEADAIVVEVPRIPEDVVAEELHIPEDVRKGLALQRNSCSLSVDDTLEKYSWVKPGVPVWYASSPTEIWPAIVRSDPYQIGSHVVVKLANLPPAYKERTGRSSVAGAALWALYQR